MPSPFRGTMQSSDQRIAVQVMIARPHCPAHLLKQCLEEIVPIITDLVNVVVIIKCADQP